MQEDLVIDIKNLVKKFGTVKALDGFNLSVQEGEIHGFLGPNGAGKSTTIRVILGLLKRNSGEVAVFGEDPWLNSTQLPEKFAYVPGDVNFWPNLTGGEIIDLLCNLRGNIDEKRRAELIKNFQLDPKKKFRTYSKGNRQKVALVAALASDVPLYILDEPTSGLDPLMEQVFQDEIRKLKKQGKTILLSSHILSEVEALCDRVTIIREGKNAGLYTLAELKKEHENLQKLFLSKYEDEK
jgi:ABC-2 type transport system ATP-binding protein